MLANRSEFTPLHKAGPPEERRGAPGLALHLDQQAHERGTGPGDDDLLGLCARETTTLGESGNDTLGGGDGRDFLSGGTGSDSLYGSDRLEGSAEGDTFSARTGRTSSSSCAAPTGSWASSPAWTGSRSPV